MFKAEWKSPIFDIFNYSNIYKKKYFFPIRGKNYRKLGVESAVFSGQEILITHWPLPGTLRLSHINHKHIQKDKQLVGNRRGDHGLNKGYSDTVSLCSFSDNNEIIYRCSCPSQDFSSTFVEVLSSSHAGSLNRRAIESNHSTLKKFTDSFVAY